MTEHATIYREVEFDAGHRVPNHEAKCRHVHGHRYRVRVACRGTIVDDPDHPDHGMLVDFGALKAMLAEHVHDVLDHAYICGPGDAVGPALADLDPTSRVVWFPYVPTAENLARWCWDVLAERVADAWPGRLALAAVDVWETPTCRATYTGAEVTA